uniref:Uncharacterized protein n=1 Tax=Oryza meridionalis TaxID=40149 RepID=A0A0E0D184_9ORYZ
MEEGVVFFPIHQHNQQSHLSLSSFFPNFLLDLLHLHCRPAAQSHHHRRRRRSTPATLVDAPHPHQLRGAVQRKEGK